MSSRRPGIEESTDVLFSFRPQPTFSKTFSVLLGALLVAIVIVAIVGFTRDQSLPRLLWSLLSGVGFVALLYLLTLLVDKAQSSARVEVRSDGTLVFRNAVGRVRTIGLRGASSVRAQKLKGAWSRAHGETFTGNRLNLDPTFGPKLTQIRVRDRNGKRLNFVVSGDIPPRELERFYEIADAFMQQ